MSEPDPAYRNNLGDQLKAAQPAAEQDIADRLFEEARASAEAAGPARSGTGSASSAGQNRPAEDNAEWSFRWTDAW